MWENYEALESMAIPEAEKERIYSGNIRSLLDI